MRSIATVFSAVLISISLTTAARTAEFTLGETKFTLYGYARVDFISDPDADLGNTTFGLGALVPGFTPGSSTKAFPYQTRTGIDSTTQIDAGTLTTRLEGDFYGNGGGQLRLRHFYADFNGVLVGQNWSNFMPTKGWPGTFDFQGPAGIPFARVLQLRYTRALANGVVVSVSAEQDLAHNLHQSPALTAAIAYDFGENHVRLAALSRNITNGAGGKTSGFGLSLSGSTPLWKGSKLDAILTGGSGIGSYLAFSSADFDSAGAAIETTGLSIGLTQEFSERMSVYATYGYRDIGAGAATDTKTLETLHFGLKYKPTERIVLGAEYFSGERTLFNNTSASADRIQGIVQFNF